MMGRVLLFLVPLVCLLSACTEPSSYEQFIPEGKASQNVYLFDVDLSDSLASYDFSFYTRIDSPVFDRSTKGSFLLDIFWVSPSDRRFEECVYYPSWEQRVSYRSGVIPPEVGEWRIAVQVPDPPAGFRGLGLTVRKN